MVRCRQQRHRQRRRQAQTRRLEQHLSYTPLQPPSSLVWIVFVSSWWFLVCFLIGNTGVDDRTGSSFVVVESFLIRPPAVARPTLLSEHRFLLHVLNNSNDKVTSNDGTDNSENENECYDLAVIGAGVVGVQAALVASSAPYHKKVCIIDAPRESGMLMNEETEEDLSIGGPTGLFSKALRDTSKRIRVSSLRGMGLREDSVWNEITQSCVDLAQSNAQDIRRQLQYANVRCVDGYASFHDSGETNSLSVATAAPTPMDNDGGTSTETTAAKTVVHAKNILIASGSKPYRPDGIPFDDGAGKKRIFDSDTINTLSYLPRSVVITGSGIIAIEFAKIFRNLGSDVTILIRDRVPRNALMKIGLDKDVAATLIADLVRSGIKIEKGCQAKSFDVPSFNNNNDSALRAPIKISLEPIDPDGGSNDGQMPPGRRTEISCDAYLAAVGRKPNTDKLNLQAAGIDLDKYGDIIIDSSLSTTAEAGNVYAAGDVLGRPFLASTGVAQGIAAVASMFGDPSSCQEEEQEEATPTAAGTNVRPNDGGGGVKCDGDVGPDGLCIDGDISLAGESFDPKSLASNPFVFPTGMERHDLLTNVYST